MDTYEVLVLGAGPGGYLCAEKSAAAGLSTVLFEEHAVGGTCLNEGCIPTKALLNSAKIYRHARNGAPFGVSCSDLLLNPQQAMTHKDKVVKTLVSGVEAGLKKNKVRLVRGHAEIIDKKGQVFEVSCEGISYYGRRLVIATGSETVVPPIDGLREGLSSGFVMTNREALTSSTVPQRLVVIGGGVIGLEMASYYLDVGSEVTVVEMLPKIAGPTDTDLSRYLQKEYEKRGIHFLLSAKVIRIDTDGLVFEMNGEVKRVDCDRILLSAGRKATVKGFGLENLNPLMTKAGIAVNEQLETNVPGLYAVGDCNGRLMLAHTAYREAEVLVQHFLGNKDTVRYESIPSVIYTDPEIASVGETEESAKEKGLNIRAVKVPLAFSGRYVAENEELGGFVKLLLDRDKNRLIGVHLAGSYASEIIAAAAIMVDTQLPVNRLKQFVFPHPTVGEALHEAINQL